MPTFSRLKRIVQVLRHRQPDLTVVLENIKNPHNASAILRSCDAFGVQDVYVIREERAFGVSKRVSSGAYKWLSIHIYSDTESCLKKLKDEGFKIFATYLSPTSLDIRDADFTQKVAIVVGSELEGISDTVLKYADEKIVIPIIGFVQSFNVSVATAIILYEAFRQRDEKGYFKKPRLDKNVRRQLFNKWKEF